MSNTSVEHWKSLIERAIHDLESELKRLSIPVIRGAFTNEPSTCIRIEDSQLTSIFPMLAPGSLCIIELRSPPAPLQQDMTLRDLHVYFRLGESQTWINHSIETPEYDDPDDIPDDEIDYQWRRPFSITDKELSALAMKVALGEGFGSLRSRDEQKEFARSAFEETPEEGKLKEHDLHEIATRAEMFYRTGVAPTTAKALEAQGKTIAETARIMGISRTRVDSALETNAPANIAKLLRKSS